MRIEKGISDNQDMVVNITRNMRQKTESVKVSAVKENESFQSLSDKPPMQLTMDERQWINLIERANKALTGGKRSFEFSIHEATNQIMVKVIDNDTHEIIREIPNEKILDMVAKMWEMAGIFVDERR
ncbi:MAG: flagellar protein FlaG [Anaerocolumna sp.]|nr:flagellar protein FlaG [Anaerocolumna sp.]